MCLCAQFVHLILPHEPGKKAHQTEKSIFKISACLSGAQFLRDAIWSFPRRLKGSTGLEEKFALPLPTPPNPTPTRLCGLTNTIAQRNWRMSCFAQHLAPSILQNWLHSLSYERCHINIIFNEGYSLHLTDSMSFQVLIRTCLTKHLWRLFNLQEKLGNVLSPGFVSFLWDQALIYYAMSWCVLSWSVN